MKRQKKQRILTTVALSILLLSAFSSLIKLQSATAASPSTNPSDLNFSKIASYLPNLGDGFPVFTDNFQTSSASNYAVSGNGTFSTSPGSATINGSGFVMASNSAPFQVCNLCAKMTATSSSGWGEFGVHIYKDPSNYVALEYNPVTHVWSLMQTVSGAAMTLCTSTSAASFPFTMTLILQGKNAVGYYSTDGATWTQVCNSRFEHNIFWDMRFAVTQYAWRSGFVSSMTSLTISNFSAYCSNGLNYRDPRPITYATGQPVLFHNCLYYAVDLGGNGIRETAQGIVSWNLTSNRLSILSMLYYSRIDSGTGQPGIFSDGAGDIFFDQQTKTWHDFFVTWGSNDLDPALVLWQAILPFNPLTARGVQIVGGSSQVALSAVTSHSQYDPAVYKVGSQWYLYFIDTNGYAGWTSVYPHLAESTDLNSWTNVYCNTSYSDREGCGVFYMGNIPYLCTSNGIYYNATTGRQMGSFSYWDNSTNYHPWAIPVGVNGEYYLLTFTCDIQYGIWYGYGAALLETYRDHGVTGHLSITAPSSSKAGSMLGPVSVTAYDSAGNVMTGYNGSIFFELSDPDANTPFTFSSPFTFDNSFDGAYAFTDGFKFFTTGTQTITVSDGVYTAESAEITVGPSNLDHLAISAPSTATAGTSFNSMTVTVYDSNNNIHKSYDGSVYFTSTDSQAAMPYTSNSPYTFSPSDNGQHNFSGFTLKTAGSNTITAVDLKSGASASAIMCVNPGILDHIQLLPKSAATAAGARQSFSPVAYDACGNILTSINGLSSWSIDSAAGGSWVQPTGTYTSQFAGSWTVKCTLLGKSASSPLTVSPGILDRITCRVDPTSVTAGQVAAGTATAYDRQNNSWSAVASWTIDEEAGGLWSGNQYTSQHAGTWDVTATYMGKTARTTLEVNAGSPNQITISTILASHIN